ncbi:alpha-amylase [Mucilaginibacter rubeus]|uniref:Alpha-amylase n=1 Tax=Mucilaginibacter rubeus TaxID=2027860 RepID=A0AAE6JLU4_9SPHI|nr:MULTISPECIES: alpha-amylase family glycosyl hydrolase [Mucilaginibacter]QEM08114.1 alpha-amylase [Mucilaginibacter rubeus]QEM20567.1 alpha-amylase [Mucilaginibacter gossypii]QTE42709.1 alpha-amylase [Mucilaginibacter rubeus]QTE49310.1 alpha-amylase [Mucilaginibacter rubeus]QTE54406.1 alpha-amylase [Mucilaginibacter rubeus]
MIIKNVYLLIAGLLLAGFTSCKKKEVLPGNSGNVPGDTVVNTGKALPAGAKDGVTFINSGKSVIFNLYAPGKKSVSVIGDFNGWDVNDTKAVMNNTPDGKRWWVQIDNIDPAAEYGYQFYIDKSLKVADPYTEKVLDPDNDSYISSDTYPNLKKYPTAKTTGNVSVFQASQPAYSWKNTSFTRPDKKNLVIYELLLRDFIDAHNYQTLTDTLKYLSNLGVNAIELMPFNEFEGNLSWGYNPSFYFAPDKYYGTKNALKAFIDECHSRGIAVIQDIVLNHSFGQSPMVQMYFNTTAGKPAANNPWYNVDPTHPYNVGYQFNHESADTKYFVKNVLKFWMTEYKIDGFRFDLSKGFTQVNYGTSDAAVNAWSQYDASRVAIWKDYNNYIKSIDNNNFYVILEHFAANQEEKELAGEGMMLWNNLNYNANEATMGWLTNSNFQGLFYDQHTFTQPYNLVGYFESHDEERLQFKNESYGNAVGSYNVKDKNTGLAREEMAAAFLFSVPGPKMLWQFGELGYDVSINQGGRTSNKPIYWNYNTDPDRRHLYGIYAKMIKMKEKNAVFASTNSTYDLAGPIKTIQLKDASANVEVVGNFDVVPQTGSISFPAAGTWYDNITKTSISVTSLTYSMTLKPGEYHVYSSVPLQQ